MEQARVNYLGIDYGEKRIGLAFADELGVAVPLPAAVQSRLAERLAHIAAIIERRRIQVIIMGYPYNMDGSVGFKAREVDAFIDKLETRFGLPIYRVDERLTSHQVESDMAWVDGKKKRKTKSPKAKRAQRASGEIDSRSAVLILREYLDSQGL